MPGSGPALRLGSDPELVAIWLLAGWLVVGCTPSEVTWRPLDPPVPAPDFSLTALDGGDVRLSELQGHVVLMEIWATWCGPCRYSTPSLEAVYRKYRDQGVRVLLVNEGESPERIRQWAQGRFTAPILLDARQTVSRQYGVFGLPTLFVIDQEGQIRYREAGYGGGIEHNLKLILHDLLAAS